MLRTLTVTASQRQAARARELTRGAVRVQVTRGGKQKQQPTAGQRTGEQPARHT